MNPFKPGMIINLMNYEEPEIEFLVDILKADIRSIIAGGLGPAVIAGQKLMGIKHPAHHATHEEQVVPYDDKGNFPPSDEVWTFSQEEIAKCIKRKVADVIAGCYGGEPKFIVWELSFRKQIEADPRGRFYIGMMGRYKILWGALSEGFWGKIKSGFYNVGKLPNMLLNWGYKKIGGKKQINWLVIPGSKEVCCTAVASATRCGLLAMSWYRLFIWEKIKKNANKAPGHNWDEKRLIRFLPR